MKTPIKYQSGFMQVLAVLGIAALALIMAYVAHKTEIQQQSAPVEQPVNLGAALPQGVAIFETSLQSGITSSATSLSLTANAVSGGSTLSGYNCFTIDEGSAQAEYVCGTVSGTAVTGMIRGVDPVTATTTNATLQFAHRRGANVKITDFPLIQIMRNQLNGVETIPGTLVYSSEPTFSSGTQVVDKTYVDGVAVAGAPNSTELVKGISQLATAAQAALGTSVGSAGARLILPSSLATSTFTNLTVAGDILALNSHAKIDPSFLNGSSDLYTFNGGVISTASSTLVATTSIAASSVTNRALILNGQAYAFPSSQNASSSVLATNGSGLLTWEPAVPIRYTYASTSVATTTSNICNKCGGAAPKFASTTPISLTIPAGVLTASSTISVKVNGTCVSGSLTGGNATVSCHILLRKSDGETIWDGGMTASASGSVPIGTYGLNVDTVGANSLSSQISVGTCSSYTTSGVGCNYVNTTSSVDFSQALSLVLVIEAAASASGGDSATLTSAGISSYSIIVNP